MNVTGSRSVSIAHLLLPASDSASGPRRACDRTSINVEIATTRRPRALVRLSERASRALAPPWEGPTRVRGVGRHDRRDPGRVLDRATQPRRVGPDPHDARHPHVGCRRDADALRTAGARDGAAPGVSRARRDAARAGARARGGGARGPRSARPGGRAALPGSPRRAPDPAHTGIPSALPAGPTGAARGRGGPGAPPRPAPRARAPARQPPQAA